MKIATFLDTTRRGSKKECKKIYFQGKILYILINGYLTEDNKIIRLMTYKIAFYNFLSSSRYTYSGYMP